MTMRAAGPVAGLALAAAVLAASLAARHAEFAESSPVTPRGGWAHVWTGGVVVALVLYGIGVVLLRRVGSLRIVLAIAVVIQALPLAAPLLLSKDSYLYWSQARVLISHGGNPYRDPPGRFAQDPSLAYVSESWRTQTTEYAPLWEIVGTAPAAAAGTSHHRAELAYRVLALLGVLAAVFLVARRTRSAAATAFVGWSPLVALHFAGGGHNDALLAALLVLAVSSAGAGGGGAWSAATFFKGWPGLLVPLELARVRLRARNGWWLGIAGVTVALSIASFAVFGTAWITTAFSGANTPTGLGGVHWLEQLGLRYRYAVLASSFVFACVYVALLAHAWRRGRARFSLATSALCLTAAQLRPWYALWPVVLAGAEEDVLAAVVAYGLTAYLLLADAVSL